MDTVILSHIMERKVQVRTIGGRAEEVSDQNICVMAGSMLRSTSEQGNRQACKGCA